MLNIKKLTALIIVGGLAAGTLGGCFGGENGDNGDNGNTHAEHTWSDYISGGESGHYRRTTCTEHEPINSEVEEHVYDGDAATVCNVCGYVRVVGEAGYYFDSTAPAGGDGSLQSPYNSFFYLNSIELKAGDVLRFKNGCEFRGGFELKEVSGTESQPIVITNYGGGTALPKFNGNNTAKGSNKGVITLENCSYITVRNIEIYDSAKSEDDRRGVMLLADSKEQGAFNTSTGITLEGLYIHDIRGTTDAANSGMSTASKITGGVQIWSYYGRGRFDKLTIKGCTIRNVDNVGIASWYRPGTSGAHKVSPYSADFGKTAHTNVVICDNDISDIGKNGIFVRNLKGGVIERNVLHDTAVRCISGNTIVTSYVHGTVIQHNEGYLNRAQPKMNNGEKDWQDGCMLDADLQSRDTVWQYNYSHDNSFGLFINCTSLLTDLNVRDKVTVRYNLSVNDKGNMAIVYINYAAELVEIYNNTFVTSAEDSPVLLKVNGSNNSADRNYAFYNNVIYNRSANASVKLSYGTNTQDISNNLVFNDDGAAIDGLDYFKQLNSEGLYVDPLLTGNIGATVEKRSGMEAANVCKLASSSPAKDEGKAVSGVAKDFFGNAYRRSLGFFCGF